MAVEKQNLRIRARSHRATLTRADYADAIARFADELALAAGTVVAGYFPLRDEADPRALMAALSERGHPLALPCVTAGQPLTFRAWKMGDPMHANPRAFNIAEPLATAAAVIPGAVLVPMLAFDPDGHRLGYGGGYYDRTLVGLRAVTSTDGMTADFYPFDMKFIGHVATRIINEVKGVNRVVYDVTSKPPGTIEWE